MASELHLNVDIERAFPIFERLEIAAENPANREIIEFIEARDFDLWHLPVIGYDADGAILRLEPTEELLILVGLLR